MSLMECLQNQDLRLEILSHLTLSEIHSSLRLCSKGCLHIANDYKTLLVEKLLSEKQTLVLIIGLQSEQEKLLNGRVGSVERYKKEDGFFQVRVDDLNWLSEKAEMKGLKLCNIHPYFRSVQSVQTTMPAALKDYSSNSLML